MKIPDPRITEQVMSFELGRSRRKLKFLERIIRATANLTDRDRLLAEIVDGATEATGTDVCSIYLWQPSERVLLLTATNGLSRSGIGKVRIELGEGVTGWVAAQRQPLAVRDVRYESRFQWVPGLDQERFISMLSVPVLARGWVAGVINVQMVEEHDFAADEIDFLVALAAEIASILELSEHHQTLTDQLSEERKAAARLLNLSGDRDGMLTTVLQEFREPLVSARTRLERVGRHIGPIEREHLDEARGYLRRVQTAVDGLLAVLGQMPIVPA